MTDPQVKSLLLQLSRIAEPPGSVKCMGFQPAQEKVLSGLDVPSYRWPDIKRMTINEAANDLAFISTGLYGKTLPLQNGGPTEMTLLWKYGSGSTKAIVKISSADKRSPTFWESIQALEYGLWANVNPAVLHLRWSRAIERLLGSDERVSTQIFDGNDNQVAALYSERKSEKLFT